MHGAAVFLQQARMFCPIFLSTIPPYIRPVISWVVTVRAHSASALSLLHQPTEGELWREGLCEREKNSALLFCARPARSERVAWERERREGPEAEEEVVLWGFDASRGYHIRSFWGSLKSLLYKTLTRLSSSFWYKGWTYKQRHNMQLCCTSMTWCSLKHLIWEILGENHYRRRSRVWCKT